MTDQIDFERIIREETPQADRLAKYIAERFTTRPLSVWDAGCGPGIYVEALRQRGLNAWGTDIRIEPPAREYVSFLNLVTSVNPTPAHIVLCLEVLEHIPEPDAEKALMCLTWAAKDRIIFSAAVPGQGGEGHVNLQSRQYWLRRFIRMGWMIDMDETDALRHHMLRGPHMGWFTNNVMVLTPR